MKPTVLFLLALSFAGCAKLAALMPGTYTGNGKIATETRPAGTFEAVELEGAYDVLLTQGPQTEVRIETDSNLLAHIKTTVSNGKLVIETSGNLQPTKSIAVYITSPNYR